MNTPPFRPARLLAMLADAGIDFVAIGGVAVVMQASPRFTQDLDICFATDPENLERLAGVLVRLDAKLRGVEEDLPFVPDSRTLSQTETLTLSTREGNLDLLTAPAGSPGYPALRRRADVVELDGQKVRVASVEDLIAMKRAAGRSQDAVDVEALEVARSRTRGRRRQDT